MIVNDVNDVRKKNYTKLMKIKTYLSTKIKL